MSTDAIPYPVLQVSPKRQPCAVRDDEEFAVLRDSIDTFPWDGAVAFRKALEQRYGSSAMGKTPGGLFNPGPQAPSEITIDTGVDTRTTVPWGRFQFPLGSSDEFLETSVTAKKGHMVFAVNANLRRKWKSEFKELMDQTREILSRESIYKGKAVRINFTTEHGEIEYMPQPTFIDLSSTRLEDMVYTKDLTEVIETNIFTVLRHTEAVRESGIPLKRGILAAGTFGTGKSLLARAIAKVGNENGWTFLYIKNAAELPYAIAFASLYQPCVVFAEDVDRFVAGDRTEEMDTILNALDGIDNKQQELMVVLTSNDAGSINEAMRRPGRLDVVLHIVPPDAEAVGRLLRLYGRTSIDSATDLTGVSEMLAGFTPAIIREAVERSKLGAIRRTGKANALIEAPDIEIAAKTIIQQQAVMQPREKSLAATWGAEMVREVAQVVHDQLKANSLGTLEQNVRRIGRDAGVAML